jgi:hypothetical protein
MFCITLLYFQACSELSAALCPYGYVLVEVLVDRLLCIGSCGYALVDLPLWIGSCGYALVEAFVDMPL